MIPAARRFRDETLLTTASVRELGALVQIGGRRAFCRRASLVGFLQGPVCLARKRGGEKDVTKT